MVWPRLRVCMAIMAAMAAIPSYGQPAQAASTPRPSSQPPQLTGHFVATYRVTAVREQSSGDLFLGFEMAVAFTSVRFRWVAPYHYELASATYHLLGHPARTSHVKGIGTCETYYSLARGRLNEFFAQLWFDDNSPIADKLGGEMYGDFSYYVYRQTCNGHAVAVSSNSTINTVPTPAIATMLLTPRGVVTKVALEGLGGLTMENSPADVVVLGSLVP
jgi:hypothetical protein